MISCTCKRDLIFSLTRPLDVHEVVLGHDEVVGDEVVLDCWVCLHDVPALAANVEVEDPAFRSRVKGRVTRLQ